MRKFFTLFFIITGLVSTVLAEEIDLKNVEKHQIKYTPKVEKETKKLTIDEDTAVEGITNLQREKDIEDIDMLWKATVENNNIIKFAMKKLSIPEDQQRYHSSLLAKSASALVNGVSFIPAMFGANYMVQSASYATGRLANNYISKANNPKEMPLTDTELIELAGMIESLQDQIINSYYNYKMALNHIKDTRQRLVLYNKNYSNAIKNNNKMEIIVSGALYDDLLFEEQEQINEAKKYHMDLERLAGKKTVQNLNLHQYGFKDELFAQKIQAKNIAEQGEQNDKK